MSRESLREKALETWLFNAKDDVQSEGDVAKAIGSRSKRFEVSGFGSKKKKQKLAGDLYVLLSGITLTRGGRVMSFHGWTKMKSFIFPDHSRSLKGGYVLLMDGGVEVEFGYKFKTPDTARQFEEEVKKELEAFGEKFLRQGNRTAEETARMRGLTVNVGVTFDEKKAEMAREQRKANRNSKATLTRRKGVPVYIYNQGDTLNYKPAVDMAVAHCERAFHVQGAKMDKGLDATLFVLDTGLAIGSGQVSFSFHGFTKIKSFLFVDSDKSIRNGYVLDCNGVDQTYAYDFDSHGLAVQFRETVKKCLEEYGKAILKQREEGKQVLSDQDMTRMRALSVATGIGFAFKANATSDDLSKHTGTRQALRSFLYNPSGISSKEEVEGAFADCPDVFEAKTGKLAVLAEGVSFLRNGELKPSFFHGFTRLKQFLFPDNKDASNAGYLLNFNDSIFKFRCNFRSGEDAFKFEEAVRRNLKTFGSSMKDIDDASSQLQGVLNNMNQRVAQLQGTQKREKERQAKLVETAMSVGEALGKMQETMVEEPEPEPEPIDPVAAEEAALGLDVLDEIIQQPDSVTLQTTVEEWSGGKKGRAEKWLAMLEDNDIDDLEVLEEIAGDDDAWDKLLADLKDVKGTGVLILKLNKWKQEQAK